MDVKVPEGTAAPSLQRGIVCNVTKSVENLHVKR